MAEKGWTLVRNTMEGGVASEKRICLRKALQGERSIAEPLGNNWFPIRLLDIPGSGIGFHCRTAVADGSARMVRFTLQSDPPIDVSATVKIIYCSKHTLLEGYRIGAAFRKMDAEHQAQISRLVSGH